MSLGEQRYFNNAVAMNEQSSMQVHTMSAILAGVVAGAFGLTGLYGLLFFCACNVITSVMVAWKGCGGQSHVYFPPGTKKSFSLDNLFKGIMSFLLVWTVVYDAIYLF